MRTVGQLSLLAALVLCAAAYARAQGAGAGAPVSKQTPPAAGAADCGCEGKPLPEVLAVVGGVKITLKDLSDSTRGRIEELRRQVVEARARELDLQINSRLLAAEAKKRGMTTVKLLETEVVARAQEPTEAEARAFYEANRARLAGSSFEAVKANVVDYLRQQRQGESARQFAERLRAAAQVKKNVEAATPPADEAERARVLATVNGQNITSGDIEDALRPLIFSVQEQVYNLLKREVELKINDTLLGAEATKRGVTTRALLESEVTAKLPAVTDADAQKFYDENRERIGGDFARTKQQIVEYLREQSERKAQGEFAERLRASAGVQTYLTPPEPPVYKVATDDQPSKGDAGAAVTLVVFTDFQCPSCAQKHATLERVFAEYGGRVRLVVRDFPLAQHADASRAAEAAEAAREQGKYWEYAAVLLQNPSALRAEQLKEYATRVGLDRAKFDAALDSGRFAEKVQRDMLEGQKLGVAATPTVFANGVRVADLSYEGLKAAVEAALKTAR